MDHILCEGDKLYQNINVEHERLLPSDIPTYIHICKKKIYVTRGKEAFGSFVGNKSKTNTILLALCAMVQIRTTSAPLCLRDKTGSLAIALFSTNSTSIYIFDSHSQNNCGMPCANGTSILIKFDNIVNTVSYICELAHALSARLFHWTFCHAVLDAQCECRITVPQMGVLLGDDIMKLYIDFLPLFLNKKRNKTKESIMHHMRKEYDNQKHLSKLPKNENMISCINKHQPQNRQQNKINKDGNIIKFKKQASRGKETPEQQKQRQQYDKAPRNASRINETPQKSKD